MPTSVTSLSLGGSLSKERLLLSRLGLVDGSTSIDAKPDILW